MRGQSRWSRQYIWLTWSSLGCASIGCNKHSWYHPQHLAFIWVELHKCQSCSQVASLSRSSWRAAALPVPQMGKYAMVSSAKNQTVEEIPSGKLFQYDIDDEARSQYRPLWDTRYFLCYVQADACLLIIRIGRNFWDILLISPYRFNWARRCLWSNFIVCEIYNKLHTLGLAG